MTTTGAQGILWIPIARKLPPRDQVVIGAIAEPDVPVIVRTVVWTGQQWKFESNQQRVDIFGRRVTHWMQLPDPPAVSY
jgi:hypothetical protein